MSEIQENQKVSKAELASTVAGALAIVAGIYFNFLQSGNNFRLVNIIIAVAFLTFVAYNFFVSQNSKALRAQLQKAIEEKDALAKEHKSLSEQLNATERTLSAVKSELSQLKKECESLREGNQE